jgi:hypothetical protein
MKNENGLFLIFEEATFTDNSKFRFINENNEVVKGIPTKSKKIKLLVKLQNLNDINGNSRFYSDTAGSTIIKVLENKSKNRCLFSELDHPIVDPETEIGRKRATTPLITNSGAIITDIRKDGNDIVGVVETLTGFRGPELRDLIVEDRVNIGFSLRMFAKLKKHPKYDEVMEVVAPFRPITYDIVSSPSHNSARVIKLINENHSFNDWADSGNSKSNANQLSMVNESENFEMIYESDNLGKYGLKNDDFNSYLEDIIKKSYSNIKSVNFKF